MNSWFRTFWLAIHCVRGSVLELKYLCTTIVYKQMPNVSCLVFLVFICCNWLLIYQSLFSVNMFIHLQGFCYALESRYLGNWAHGNGSQIKDPWLLELKDKFKHTERIVKLCVNSKRKTVFIISSSFFYELGKLITLWISSIWGKDWQCPKGTWKCCLKICGYEFSNSRYLFAKMKIPPGSKKLFDHIGTRFWTPGLHLEEYHFMY